MEGIDGVWQMILRIMQESVTYLDDGEEENIAEGMLCMSVRIGAKALGHETCPNCGSVLAF